jgi:hypothetical protein
MTDFLVDTPGGNCGNQSAGAGASLTSGVTYDGGFLGCLGVQASSQNLNEVLSKINLSFCSIKNLANVNNTSIYNINQSLTSLTNTVNNLNVSEITDFNSYSCLTPAGSTLEDTLTAISDYLCGISGLTETQVTDLEGIERGWKWRQRAGGHIFNEGNTFTWTPSTGLNGTINSGWVSPPEGLPRLKPALPLALAPNRDNWIYANANTGVTKTDTVIGAVMPAPSTEEVILYKIRTDATSITATEDLRVFQPFDETLFTPTTNLSGFIPTGSLAPTALDLSSVISYDTAVPIIANENIVHKKYVDDSIAALSSSLWTDLGGGSGIYYNAAPVGIGTSSPDASSVLTISGALKYVDGSEGAGKILQSDSNGFATWVDIVAGSIDIENEGVALGQMATLNFIGAGVNAVDMGGGVVDITITGSVSTFNDLSDVSVGGATDKQTLRFNGTNWILSSSLQNTGSRISIGDVPGTIDAKLHILDASGDDLLKVVGTGGTYFDIDSAGISKFSTFVRYTETNGGANPLGSGKVLSDIDGTGKLVWIDSVVNPTLSGVLGFGNTTGANWINVNNGYGLTNTDTISGNSLTREINYTALGLLRLSNINNTTTDEAYIDINGLGIIGINADNGVTINSADVLVDGSGTFKGIEYNADYSANYVNRSLVDKEYVDNAVSGGGTIGGSGTLNRVAKFTPNGTTLGSSLIQDDGTTIGIGTTPSAFIFFQNSSALNQTSRSLNTSTAAATKIAFEGNALGVNGTNIGLYGYAINGATNYSCKLQDGSEAVGRFLKSITADGKANWSTITESDITGFGTYVKVGTYTDGYVPRWNATLNTLESGSVRDNGLGNVAINSAVNTNQALRVIGTSLNITIYSSNTYANPSGSNFSIWGNATGTANLNNYGVTGLSSNATGNNIGVAGSTNAIIPQEVNLKNIGVLGGLGTITGATLPSAGLAASINQSNNQDSYGLYVNVSNPGAGNAYIGVLKDGTEGAGKVLTSNANGLATWATIDVANVTGAASLASPTFTGNMSISIPSTLTPTGTTETINWDNGNGQILSLASATGTVVLTLSNPKEGATYFVKVIQHATTPRNVTFPATVKFPGGTAPTISTGASAIDTVVLFFDGTNYFANFAQAYS